MLRGDNLWHIADGFLECLKPYRAVVVGSDQNKDLVAEANGGCVNDGQACLHNPDQFEAFDWAHILLKGVYRWRKTHARQSLVYHCARQP